MVRVNMKDKVEVTCLGKTTTTYRGEALKTYSVLMYGCTSYSKEFDKYNNVIAQLNAGMLVVNDNNENW